MNTSARLLCLLLAFVCFATADSRAEIVISDAFSDGTIAGQPLNKRRVEQGDEIWEAAGDLIILRDGDRGFASVRTLGSLVARLPVPKKAKILTMEGSLRAAPGTDKMSWVAIGLGNPSLNPISITWPEGVFVLLNTSGEFECHYNPGGSGAKLRRLKSGKVAGFDVAKPTSFLVRLDREFLTLDVEVNRVVVLDHYELANVAPSLAPSFAGFSGYGQKPGTDIISRFSLKTAP